MDTNLALMLLCIFILLLIHFFHFQFWDCEQNLIPNMWEVVFPNISIEGGVVHPDVHRHFDGSGQAVFFSSNNFKVLHRCFMATATLMFKYWRWGLQMFLECFDVVVCFFSFLCCFLKIFFIAHLGYLHWPSTSSRCCNSFSISFGVEQMVCALCVRVFITLYLAAKLWLLSHGRYRSECVGFL